jgi:cell wall-associated NlpC family hydrolase
VCAGTRQTWRDAVILRNGTIAAALALTCTLVPPALPVLADGGMHPDQTQQTVTDGMTQDQRLAQTARWAALTRKVADESGVPWQVLRAIMSVETGGDSGAYELESGGIGLLLVEPEVKLATSFGYQGNLWNPETNLRVAAEYLVAAHRQWASWELAVMTYANRDLDVTGRPYPVEYMHQYHIALSDLDYAAPPEELAGAALAHALRMHGVPYLAGGQSPEHGFDCSGLVWWAYLQTGREIARDAGSQLATSQPIDIGQARPGDLVFFADGGAIFHVGLYAGNGNMLHAPREGETVSFASLSDPYWSGYLAGFGRMT